MSTVRVRMTRYVNTGTPLVVGQVYDLPDDVARPLLERGQAVPETVRVERGGASVEVAVSRPGEQRKARR